MRHHAGFFRFVISLTPQNSYIVDISHFSDEETKIYRGQIKSSRLYSNRAIYIYIYSTLQSQRTVPSTHLLDTGMHNDWAL